MLHKLSPPYLYDSFHYTVDITSRAAQNAHRLFVPRVRTKIAKNQFLFPWYTNLELAQSHTLCSKDSG